MSIPAQTQQPNPALIFETLNAYQRTAALKAAIDLDVFTALGEGKTTSQEVAARSKTSERGMRILCDYLTVIGFLNKSGSRYGLTPDSATFLNQHSPAYMGTAAKFLSLPALTDGFKDLAGAVRKGGTVASEEGSMAPEHPMWLEFARSMAPMMALPAGLIAQLVGAEAGWKWKVLDIAAGHGLFGITIAQKNPQAEVVSQDWPGVLALAQENARAAGVSGRFRPLPGSAFEVDFGGGYHLVLLTNFLHHFDVETCEKLLRKARAALLPGGRAVTLEFVPNEDRVSPPVAASFSLMMLGSTRAGDAYTFSEYDRMFSNAGFTRSELHALPPTPESVVISHC